jgi:catalase
MRVIETHAGAEKGYRRAHARGLVFHATITPAPEAKALTVAEHFQGPEVHAVVRFSNSASSPHAPDRLSNSAGQVLGLAVRFDLPSGAHATWAGVNLPAFVTRTPEDFVELVMAQRPSFIPGKPNPLRLLWFVLTHLYALPGLLGAASLKPLPSFATTAYNSMHAYFLRDASGQRRAFRYRWTPLAGSAGLSRAEAKALPQQYLLDEIRQRVSRGPVGWDLVFCLGNPGDPTDDASKAWPEDRRQVTVGRLMLDRLFEDQKASELFVFDPTGVVPGIELSEDPILHFRAKIYGESYARRSQETKAPDQPADMLQAGPQ